MSAENYSYYFSQNSKIISTKLVSFNIFSVNSVESIAIFPIASRAFKKIIIKH